MVRLHVKHSHDSDTQLEFLHDGQTSSKIQDLTRQLTEMANLQRQIHHIASALLPNVSALLHSNQLVKGLHRALSEASSYSSKDQVLHGRALSKLVLKEHIKSIEKEFAATHYLLDIAEPDLQKILSDLESLHESSVQLWWAGKELDRDRSLRDYVGKNEKTKIVLILQAFVSSPSNKTFTDETADGAVIHHGSGDLGK